MLLYSGLGCMHSTYMYALWVEIRFWIYWVKNKCIIKMNFTWVFRATSEKWWNRQSILCLWEIQNPIKKLQHTRHRTEHSCIEMGKKRDLTWSASTPPPDWHNSVPREISWACDFYSCVWRVGGMEHMPGLPVFHWASHRAGFRPASHQVLKESALFGSLEQIRAKEKRKEGPWSQHRSTRLRKQHWHLSPNKEGEEWNMSPTSSVFSALPERPVHPTSHRMPKNPVQLDTKGSKRLQDPEREVGARRYRAPESSQVADLCSQSQSITSGRSGSFFKCIDLNTKLQNMKNQENMTQPKE